MKLRSRIKYILLPIIVVALALPATLGYVIIKNTIVTHLGEQLLSDVHRVSDDILQQAHESEGLIRLFLSSREAVGYLNSENIGEKAYSYSVGMFNNFSIAKKTSSFLEKVTIFDLRGKAVFNFDMTDPFSSPVSETQSTVLLSKINEGSNFERDQDQWSANFVVQPVGLDSVRLVIVMPFSASLMLSDVGFSEKDDLYVVQLTNSSELFARAQERVRQTYDGGASLFVEPNTITPQISSSSLVESNNDVSTGIKRSLKQPFGTISVHMSPEYVEAKIAPLRNTIVATILLLMAVMYLSLRAVIHVQIINPITKLASQVKDSFGGGELQLKPSTLKDEVSELNNNYLELFSHVSHLANFDSLTGLLNRVSFGNALKRSIQDAVRKKTKTALLYIDLDNFKKVNDSYGHSEGDALLIEFGLKLKDAIRPFDELHALNEERGVARLAGDEFAILLTNLPNIEAADTVAKRIMALFETGFLVGNTFHDVQACIGISIAPDDGIEPEILMRNADAAMYTAKQDGKNGYRFYSGEIESALQNKHDIENGLKSALDNDLFYLVYMPIYDCQDLSIVGVEVLLRTTEPLLHNYTTEEYITVAEQAGLIVKIDLYVIEAALKSIQPLAEQAQYDGFIAINVSARELHNSCFPRDVETLLHKYDVDPSRIELEITETCLEPNDLGLVDTLNALKSLGIRLSLDDFGTGYTGFSQLASYPVDILKIDRSFVSQIHEARNDKRLTVDIIVDLARLYDMSIVAEGVEDIQQFHYVQSLGVECVQGYYLSKPLSISAFIALLQSITVEYQGN